MTLVGWSLGGLYAHELARRFPGSVRQVITLGSPVQVAGRRGRSASESFDRLAPLRITSARPVRPWREAGSFRVPATSVYSRGDGLVPWRACRLPAGSRCENVEVVGSHAGLGHNPMVLHVLADRLAQRDGSWEPFRPGRLLANRYR